MNKNVFLIILIGLIAVIYVIDNYRLLTKTKSNENFDAISDNASGNISKNSSPTSKTNNSNETESELLDLLKSHIESEIDQITKSKIKSEIKSEIKTKIETKTESESEMINVSDSGDWITVIGIIILILCGFSCLTNIFNPSTPTQAVQPIVYQYPPPPLPPPVYSYPPLQAYPYPPPPNLYS